MINPLLLSLFSGGQQASSIMPFPKGYDTFPTGNEPSAPVDLASILGNLGRANDEEIGAYSIPDPAIPTGYDRPGNEGLAFLGSLIANAIGGGNAGDSFRQGYRGGVQGRQSREYTKSQQDVERERRMKLLKAKQMREGAQMQYGQVQAQQKAETDLAHDLAVVDAQNQGRLALQDLKGDETRQKQLLKDISSAPSPELRAMAMRQLRTQFPDQYKGYTDADIELQAKTYTPKEQQQLAGADLSKARTVTENLTRDGKVKKLLLENKHIEAKTEYTNAQSSYRRMLTAIYPQKIQKELAIKQQNANTSLKRANDALALGLQRIQNQGQINPAMAFKLREQAQKGIDDSESYLVMLKEQEGQLSKKLGAKLNDAERVKYEDALSNNRAQQVWIGDKLERSKGALDRITQASLPQGFGITPAVSGFAPVPVGPIQSRNRSF